MGGRRPPSIRARAPSTGARPGISPGLVLLGLLLPAAGILAASCSFNYGEALAEDLEDRTPDAVFVRFTHTIVQDNRPALVLEAERAELYDRRNLVRLKGVRFRELRDGKTLAYGSAEEAVLNTETEDAEFTGAVHLRSERDGVTIRADYLSWKSEDRVLESREDRTTSIEKDDGSGLRGTGFRADARRKGVSFSGRVDGVLVRPEPGEGE